MDMWKWYESASPFFLGTLTVPGGGAYGLGSLPEKKIKIWFDVEKLRYEYENVSSLLVHYMNEEGCGDEKGFIFKSNKSKG